jgi:hypothetical protein
MKVDREWDMHHTREYMCMQNISHFTWKKRALGRYCQWWENSIEMGIREIGYEGVDWILVAEDGVQCQTLVNKRICLCLLWKVGYILSRWVTVSHKGLYWHRLWFGGRHLWTQEFARVFHERLGVSWVAGWRFLKKDCTVWSETVIWKLCFCLFSKFSVSSHP